MTINCAPITTEADQTAFDNLIQHCMQHGLTMMSTRNSQDRISLTVQDNGSDGYKTLESFVQMRHSIFTEQGK